MSILEFNIFQVFPDILLLFFLFLHVEGRRLLPYVSHLILLFVALFCIDLNSLLFRRTILPCLLYY